LLSSNHYLESTSQVQGLIYGAMWGLSRSLVNPVKSLRGMVLTNNNQRKLFPVPHSVIDG